jgi:tripartite-type tricarboxylate transporter receptor subunit TctC
LLLAGLLAVSVAGASAQDYPNRPITVIVPFPAGGPTDAIIRNLGERMRVSLGQPLIVEYVTGAAAPSAQPRQPRRAVRLHHHLRSTSAPTPPTARSYQLPYDLVTDFTPISLLPRNPYLIVRRRDLPPGHLASSWPILKANPGKVNMGPSRRRHRPASARPFNWRTSPAAR